MSFNKTIVKISNKKRAELYSKAFLISLVISFIGLTGAIILYYMSRNIIFAVIILFFLTVFFLNLSMILKTKIFEYEDSGYVTTIRQYHPLSDGKKITTEYPNHIIEKFRIEKALLVLYLKWNNDQILKIKYRLKGLKKEQLKQLQYSLYNNCNEEDQF